VAEYRQFAAQFNPVKYNPDEWVPARQRGRHEVHRHHLETHDGFALFDSKASDWNVVKATPYGKFVTTDSSGRDFHGRPGNLAVKPVSDDWQPST